MRPITIRQVYGSTRWALYWTEDWIKIATFASEFTAWQARNAILSNK